MTRDRRIRSLMADRAIDTPDTHCQTHGVPFDENRRCPACRLALAEFPYVDEAATAEELVRECDDDCPHPSHEEQP